MREVERHGAVAQWSAAIFELAPLAPQRDDRVLAVAHDQREALVGRWQRLDCGARGLQQVDARPRPVGPVVGVERIEVLAGSGERQQRAQAGEGRQDPVRDLSRVVMQVEHREPAHERVRAAQRLHRDESAAVRRPELDHARDAVRARARERGARDEPAHAVADQDHVLATFTHQPRGECCARGRDVLAPVVGVVGRVEARDTEHQAQALVGELQHALRRVAAALRQRELGELARSDLEGVEPGDVRAAVLADPPDGRAHDARQDQDTRSAAHAGGASRQPREFLIRLKVRRHREILMVPGRSFVV